MYSKFIALFICVVFFSCNSNKLTVDVKKLQYVDDFVLDLEIETPRKVEVNLIYIYACQTSTKDFNFFPGPLTIVKLRKENKFEIVFPNEYNYPDRESIILNPGVNRIFVKKRYLFDHSQFNGGWYDIYVKLLFKSGSINQYCIKKFL